MPFDDNLGRFRCTTCEGEGWIIIGWDDYNYENIDQECGTCNGDGWLFTTPPAADESEDE